MSRLGDLLLLLVFVGVLAGSQLEGGPAGGKEPETLASRVTTPQERAPAVPRPKVRRYVPPKPRPPGRRRGSSVREGSRTYSSGYSSSRSRSFSGGGYSFGK